MRGPATVGLGWSSPVDSTPSRGDARPLLRDVAFEHLRTRIVDGTYAPGTFLSEREVARTLEMSKTPIRVAFERLAEQGFVAISPQRGVVVREMAAAEVAEHYDLRIALETFVVRRLAEDGLPGPHRGLLESNLREQERAVEGEVDIQAFMAADAAFHLLLAEALGNQEILQVMSHRRDRMRRVVESIHQRDPRVPTTSAREHAQILGAVLAGDADAAARAVEAHLENGKRFLLLGGAYGRTG